MAECSLVELTIIFTIGLIILFILYLQIFSLLSCMTVKASNPHIGEPASSTFLAFLLKKIQMIDYQNSCWLIFC